MKTSKILPLAILSWLSNITFERLLLDVSTPQNFVFDSLNILKLWRKFGCIKLVQTLKTCTFVLPRGAQVFYFPPMNCFVLHWQKGAKMGKLNLPTLTSRGPIFIKEDHNNAHELIEPFSNDLMKWHVRKLVQMRRRLTYLVHQ